MRNKINSAEIKFIKLLLALMNYCARLAFPLLIIRKLDKIYKKIFQTLDCRQHRK